MPGVGASGVIGLAFEVILPPVQSALATATTGGTITAGTYKYVVTALNASGETSASNEQTIVTTGSTSTVTVTWVAVTGATGYKLYKTAAGGATQTELLYKTVGAVTSDIDTSPGTPTGAFPTLNSAYSPGTYTAPTKFFPLISESLVTPQATIWRRPIRNSADVIGAVAGNFNVQGDITAEFLEDVSIYLLGASRVSIVKSGSSPNFVYTITPSAIAIPAKTLSITAVRNGIVFGYVGCVVVQNSFTVNDGLLMHNVSVIGRDEAVQSVPTPTWPTTVPFGAGQYSIEIPTGSAVLDTDTFEWTLNDNGTPNFRLKNTGRGAQFINFGERESTLKFERDFETRADYDAFKALTAQAITITASKGTNNSVSIVSPVAVKDTYEVSMPGQGDLVRASINYRNIADATGVCYTMTLKTQESIPVP